MYILARRRRLLPTLALVFAGLPRVLVAQSGTMTIVATDSLASEGVSGVVLPPGLAPIGAPGSGEFTIRLSQRTPAALTVTIDVSGTARGKSDFADLGTSVTIPAGASSLVIPLTVLDDRDVEPDETVIVSVRGARGYTVASGPAIVTIVDNDQAVEFTATQQGLAEPAGSASVTVRRLGTLRGALVVRLAYAGSATRNADYTAAADSVILASGRATATVVITVRNDNTAEGAETVVVSASSPAMSTGPLALTIADAGATLTGPSTPAAEVEGGTIAFVLTRTGVLTSPASFSVTMTGTATNGVDYQGIPSSITIPAGAPSVTITATIRGDLAAEQAETVHVLLFGNASYPSSSFIAQIAANGPLPTSISLSSASTPFNTEVTGTVTLLEPAVAGTTVTITSSNPVVTVSDASGALPYASQVAVPVTSGATSVGFRARAGNGTGSAVANLVAAPATASLTVSGVVTHVVGTATSPTSPVLDTTSIVSGGSRQGVIRLSAPLTATAFVPLASTNAAVQVPPNVTIAANTSQVAFNLVASSVTSLQQGLVIASRNGMVDTLTVRVLPPVAVATLSLPAQVASGASATGTVTLNQAAPAGGMVVQLTANSPNLQVPATVTVAQNATSATFPASAPTFGAPSNQQVQVSATAGGATVSASVTLLAHTLSLVMGGFPFGGQSYTFEVRLNRPAPATGLVATLSSSHAALPLPSTVAFASGDTSRSVTVATQGVSTNVGVVITASFGASLVKNTVTLSAPQLASFAIAPFSTSGAGATATGTVTLNGATPPAGLQLNVTTANATRAAVPAVVTFPGNASSTQFTMTTLPAVDAGNNGPVSVTVALPDGQQRTASFSANAGVVLSSLTIAPSTIAAGAGVTATVSLSQPAPAGGKTFTISLLSGASAVTIPSSVTIPEGAPSSTFTITTHPNTGGQVVTVGVGTRTASLTITP